MIQRVPALVGHDPPANRPAEQIQVADQIQHLVPHAFVGEAELIFDRPARRDDQQILRRQVLAQPAAAQLLRLLLEDKRAGRGELLDEIVLAQMKREHLPPDRRRRFEIVDDFQPVRRPRQGGDRRVLVGHLDRLA